MLGGHPGVSDVERAVAFWTSALDWDLYPPDVVVLADPDGNPFCVVDLSTAPSG
ncbi:VOC family protein [Pseudonocardia sp. CA-107938]|uniref:VOC family protein n=1 Tax=Pseudonocardia sp. CA-107938 TaxID=3240021 RepID=UPI003D8CCA4C